MKPDVLVTWPSNCDYPLWRQYIKKNRNRFGEVVVVFMETNQGFDYRKFVKDQITPDGVNCVYSPAVGVGDWRNIAINAGLLEPMTSEYIWFTEQDFIVWPGYWEWIDKHPGKIYAVKQGDRIHPCSLLIHWDVLKKTKCDFSAKPPEYDHFGRIQKDIENMKETIRNIPESLYFHYNGLSHNWRLVSEGEKPVWEPDIFYAYLEKTIACPAELHPNFYRIAKQALLTQNL